MTDGLEESVPMRDRRSFAPRGGYPTLGRGEIVALKANTKAAELPTQASSESNRLEMKL